MTGRFLSRSENSKEKYKNDGDCNLNLYRFFISRSGADLGLPTSIHTPPRFVPLHFLIYHGKRPKLRSRGGKH